jgi:hypothetical protein
VNWTEPTDAPTNAAWASVASSADGSQLAAVVNGGGLYISADSGVTWTELTAAPTNATWASVASSSDGSHLVAAVASGGIFTTPNLIASGVAGTSAIWQYLGNGQWGAVRQGLNATNLSGTIPLANLPKTVVTNNGTGVTLSGRFAGSGAGLTNLAATNLTGTFADARLSTNVALLSAPQAFTGANRFAGAVTLTNAANTVAGVFAGNGTGLTNLAATNLTGTVADARLSTNVAQLSANQALPRREPLCRRGGVDQCRQHAGRHPQRQRRRVDQSQRRRHQRRDHHQPPDWRTHVLHHQRHHH